MQRMLCEQSPPGTVCINAQTHTQRVDCLSRRGQDAIIDVIDADTVQGVDPPAAHNGQQPVRDGWATQYRRGIAPRAVKSPTRLRHSVN